jgi:hypothetical protein
MLASTTGLPYSSISTPSTARWACGWLLRLRSAAGSRRSAQDCVSSSPCSSSFRNSFSNFPLVQNSPVRSRCSDHFADRLGFASRRDGGRMASFPRSKRRFRFSNCSMPNIQYFQGGVRLKWSLQTHPSAREKKHGAQPR